MPANHRTGLYVFSLQRQDSLILGKNFITMENPAASGKILTLGAFFISYMATVASPAYPMRGYRTTSVPTGGTLHTASQICRLDTALPDSVAVIRSGDPSASLGPAFFNSPVGTVKDTVSGVHDVDAPAGFNPFVVRPGEAVVLRQDIGAVGHLWNVSILWREVAP
jgi:hypothetical protein